MCIHTRRVHSLYSSTGTKITYLVTSTSDISIQVSRKVPLTERKVVLVQGAQKGADKTVSHMLAVISITTFATSFASTTFATSFATALSSSPTLFR